MTSIALRCAAADEVPALDALALAAKAHWGYPPEQLAIWAPGLALDAERVSAGGLYVAEAAGQLCGFAGLLRVGRLMRLDHLWVLPAAMGQGVGRALLAHARAQARAAGAPAILIDADPHAEPFYLACGARRCGSIAAPIAGKASRCRPQLVLTSL